MSELEDAAKSATLAFIGGCNRVIGLIESGAPSAEILLASQAVRADVEAWSDYVAALCRREGMKA